MCDERHFRHLLIQPSPQSSADFKAESGCSGLAQLVLEISKVKTLQPLWTPVAVLHHSHGEEFLLFVPLEFPLL